MRAVALSAFIALLAVEPGLTSCVGVAEEMAPRHVLTWGQMGEGEGEFHSPIHLAVRPLDATHDEISVADLNNSRVQVFTEEGKFLRQFDLPRDMPERKSCIAGGMAVDERGQVYVSFMVRHTFAVYSSQGELLREWGKKGAAEGEFHTPGGIMLLPDEALLVADQGNHRVQRFTRDGKFLGAWGQHGGEPGQFGGPEPAGSRFAGPHFIACDSQGAIFTTEGALGRIQRLSATGEPLAAWGNKGDEPGGFGSYSFGKLANTFGPIGVAIDPHDRVWVSSLNDRVQVFTAEGKYLFGIGGSGSEPGQFIHPHAMAFDRHGHVYIADSGNQRIQKFAIP